MAQTYKILGSVTPQKARTPEIFNYIKNPSFEGRSLENWKPWVSDGRYRLYVTYRPTEAITPGASTNPGFTARTWGSAICARFTSDADISCGLYMSENMNTAHAAGNAAGNPNNLIPVRGGKKYYGGWSQAQATTGTNNILMRIYQYDGDKRWITWTDLNYNPGNVSWQGGESLWHRFYSDITTETDCKYVSISFWSSNGSNSCPWVDDLYFGESLEYAAAPLNPDAFLDMTFLPPFDKRRIGYIGEKHNSYTGKTFAGPLSLLYEAPKQASISSVLVNNFGKVATPYRVALIRNGETLNNLSLKNFVQFDEVIKPRNSETHIQSMALSAGDKVYVSADSGEVSFKLFGVEVD